MVTNALLFGGLGLVAGIIGALIAAVGSRGASSLTSYVQHFAAGLIIAAAGLDLIPAAINTGVKWPIVIGFIVGSIFMVLLRQVMSSAGGHSHGHGDEHAAHDDGHGDPHAAHGNAAHGTHSAGLNWALIASLAVVVLIDGAIIGVAMSADQSGALLIAIALSIELLFVAMSVVGSSRGRGASTGASVGAAIGVAVAMPIGAVLGALVFADVSASILAGALAFGAAALLFTAIEELLLEAHEVKESSGTALMGAAGFLVFVALMLFIPAA